MDVIAVGSLMGERIEVAMEALEEMVANAYQWPSK